MYKTLTTPFTISISLCYRWASPIHILIQCCQCSCWWPIVISSSTGCHTIHMKDMSVVCGDVDMLHILSGVTLNTSNEALNVWLHLLQATIHIEKKEIARRKLFSLWNPMNLWGGFKCENTTLVGFLKYNRTVHENNFAKSKKRWLVNIVPLLQRF